MACERAKEVPLRRFVSVVLPLFLLVLLLAEPATPALAQAKEDAEAGNVLVKFSLNRQDPDGTKTSRSIQAVVRIDGDTTRVNEGIRIPMPAQGVEAKTSSYENVGLSLIVEAGSSAGRSLRLHGRLEDSSLQGTSAPPIIRSLSYELGDVLVTEGKPRAVLALDRALVRGVHGFHPRA